VVAFTVGTLAARTGSDELMKLLSEILPLTSIGRTIECVWARTGNWNLVLAAAPMIDCQAAFASKVGWQKWSRAASMAAHSGEFDKAAMLYDHAIESFSGQEPVGDVLYDLNLNLADSYRRAGRLEDARRVLALCFQAGSGNSGDDPLLAAWYWRRETSQMP
jgi:hypothetical protein